ncbi:4-hydroxybenzoate polyprenyltransferase [hydrothermal vent metagenome]|uniref:4-hydroxybenzoate polyprenyltransferase n=1 Tax=hydrothermal vent metagenome TaxID=652676 RepID=A0A3B0WBY5_9ZZZZ
MAKSPLNSAFISTLLPKIVHFGQNSYTFLKELFGVMSDQIKAVSWLLIKLIEKILKQIDNFVDYLATHPIFDFLEIRYKKASNKIGELKTGTEKRYAIIQQSLPYKKAVLYAQLTRVDKPIGILLLLWPTLIALWIAAEGFPDPLVLLVFVFGVILMRSAGCAINDYADRDIDGKVKRTTQRPLVAGTITPKEALIVFATLSLLAFTLVLFMNTLTVIMSFIGVLLAVSYPFMKRYHYLPQVHLGAAFGWSAPMAYAAQANEVTAITWLIFLATILWATAYDTMYAMVDYDDDIKIGVKSTAILFGNQDKLIIAAIQALLIFDLILIGHRAELSGFYYLGVAAATLFAIYQQYLIKDRKREKCFQAFLNNNWFGMVLFIGVLLDYQFATAI